MGVMEVTDELQRVVEQQVASGRAVSPAAFLEDAVMRLVDAAGAEEDELLRVAEEGAADIAAGRYITIASPDDEQRLERDMMARLRSRLSAAS